MHNSLGPTLRQRRQQLGLQIRQVAEVVGVASSSILRFEDGSRRPSPETLQRLAVALQMHAADLFAIGGYATPVELPSIRPYLRARYDLSEQAISDVERYLARYGDPTSHGPNNGEDEAPE